MRKFNSWIEENKGLWYNIHQKRKRGERMRKKGEKGAPTQDAIRNAQGRSESISEADPKVGTGKKPKGSDRRLYTDENPKDTVGIKFATPADAKATVAKVKKIKKPYARKIQILTVGEQRAKVMGKTEVVSIFKKAKEELRAAEKKKRVDEDAPANSVAGGGVDMNVTGGRRKMDRRMKYHPDAMFRRTKRITDGAINNILKRRND